MRQSWQGYTGRGQQRPEGCKEKRTGIGIDVVAIGDGDAREDLAPIPGCGAAGAEFFEEIAGKSVIALAGDQMPQHPRRRARRIDLSHAPSPFGSGIVRQSFWST